MELSASLDGAKIIYRYLSIVLLFLVLNNGVEAIGAEKRHGSIGTSVVPTAVGHLVVLKVAKNSPAAQKGVLPGDLIFEVNGFDLTGSDFAQVVTKHLWGVTGSEVKLKILRPGKKGVISLRLVRARMPEKPVDLPGVKMVLPGETSR